MIVKPTIWEDILNISTEVQLDLWYDMVGTRKLYQPILSPFRSDTRIGGNVYLDTWHDKIVLADFTNRNFHNIDVFNAIQKYYNLTFREMCEYIKKKTTLVHIPCVKCETEKIDRKCYITFQALNGYYKPTLDYFETYGITQKDLQADGHINTDKLHVNRYDKFKKERVLELWKMQPCHLIYTFKSGNIKLYQPLEDTAKSRWCLSNTNKDDFFEIKGDKSVLVIGSSYKDVKCYIKALNLKGSGIAPQSESLSKGINWAFTEEYEKVIILKDNDKAGIDFEKNLLELIPNADTFQYPENLPERNQYGKRIKDIGELYRFDKKIITDVTNKI